MDTIEKHFVVFESPGTFLAETTAKPIDSWDVEQAKKLAHDIVERYNATPYGFRFITRTRGPEDLDSHVSARSGMYYLGGEIQTLAEIEAANRPEDKILLCNMRANKWNRVISNCNSWPITLPLTEDDTVLEWER